MIQINPRFPEDMIPETEPRFRPGDVVRHKRYGYRGVIVSVDPHCKASPTWYMSNQTQPDRDQAWYHVLVDGSESCTYPAEENLILEDEPSPVKHPWLGKFFAGFIEGRYVRNETPWPV